MKNSRFCQLELVTVAEKRPKKPVIIFRTSNKVDKNRNHESSSEFYYMSPSLLGESLSVDFARHPLLVDRRPQISFVNFQTICMAICRQVGVDK